MVAKPKLKKALVLKFTRILRRGFVPAAEHHVSIPNKERTQVVWNGWFIAVVSTWFSVELAGGT